MKSWRYVFFLFATRNAEKFQGNYLLNQQFRILRHFITLSKS